jgi:hypothetical protein
VTALVQSVIVYLSLCAVATAAGLALTRVIGPGLAAWPRLFLAPVTCLAVWAVFLGGGVALGVTVRSLVGLLGAVTLGLAGWGVWGLVRRWRSGVRPEASSLAVLAMVLLLPIGALWPFFWHGLADYPGSIAPDGWSYVAYGQYLWDHRRFEDGGLAPLYQYAAHLSITRHVSASLLSFLALWTRLFARDVPAADAQVGLGLLLGWALYAFGAACAAVGTVAGLRPIWLPGYLVLAVVSGWVGNVVYANNLDNALALGFSPALVALVTLVPAGSWRAAVHLGLLGAAALYIQPELALLIGATLGLVAVDRLVRERAPLRAWSVTLGGAAAVALVLVAPFLASLVAFIRLQSFNALSVRVGGTLFDGLTLSRYHPAAFWGLGGEHRAESWLPARNLLGGLLSAAAVAGAWALFKQRQHALLFAAALVLPAFGFLAGSQGYGYGAYKILLLGWWVLALLPVMGLTYLAPRSRTATAAAAAALTVVAAASTAFHEGSRTTRGFGNHLHNTMWRVRAVREIADVVGGGGVLLAVDNAWANQWAVHYLRDLRLYVGTRRSYMAQPWVVPFMDRAAPVPLEDVRYVLTDDRFDAGLGGAPVWSAGPYRLWPLPPRWAALVDMRDPDGIESDEGRLAVTFGPGAAELEVLAARACTLEVGGTVTAPGARPSRVEVVADGVPRREVALGPGTGFLAVPVNAGRTRISLASPAGVGLTAVRVRCDGGGIAGPAGPPVVAR